MKKSIILFLIMAGVIFLQTNFLNAFAFQNVKPDIALILLIYFSLRENRIYGTVTGFFSGLLEDFLSLAPLGFHSFIKTLIAFLSATLGSFISVNSRVFHSLTVAIATFMKYLFAALLISIFSIDKSANPFGNSSFFIEVIYNAVLTPLIFSLVNWIYSKLVRK